MTGVQTCALPISRDLGREIEIGSGLSATDRMITTPPDGVAEGDVLYVIDTAEGIKLVPYDPDFEAVLESNREYMKRHRNALHELSKR